MDRLYFIKNNSLTSYEFSFLSLENCFKIILDDKIIAFYEEEWFEYIKCFNSLEKIAKKFEIFPKNTIVFVVDCNPREKTIEAVDWLKTAIKNSEKNAVYKIIKY